MLKWIKLIRFIKKNRKQGVHKFTINSTSDHLYIFAVSHEKEVHGATSICYKKYFRLKLPKFKK